MQKPYLVLAKDRVSEFAKLSPIELLVGRTKDLKEDLVILVCLFNIVNL